MLCGNLEMLHGPHDLLLPESCIISFTQSLPMSSAVDTISQTRTNCPVIVNTINLYQLHLGTALRN